MDFSTVSSGSTDHDINTALCHSIAKDTIMVLGSSTDHQTQRTFGDDMSHWYHYDYLW